MPIMKFYRKNIDKKTIIFTKKTRLWCQLPYPGHPRGCPNYGVNPHCPPRAPYRKDVLDKYDQFTLVWVEFDILAYIKMMKTKHPEWTNNQLKCVLYWQNSLKNKLWKETNLFSYDELLGAGAGFKDTQSMESAGIYVLQTLKNNGIDIETKPRNKVILVTLLMSKCKISEIGPNLLFK